MTPSPSSPSPATKAERTRAALLDAVDAIALRDGADAVTTTAVTRACGLSVGTFYRYFPDREAALGAAFDRASGELHRRWFGALDGLDRASPAEAGRRMMDAHAALLDEVEAYVPLLDAVRRVRPVAAQDAQRDARAQSAVFAERLGIELTPDNAVRIHVLRTVTGTLTMHYALAAGAERRRLHAEIVRIASQAVEAMRADAPAG